MKIIVATSLTEAIKRLDRDVDIAIIEVRQATTYCKVIVRTYHERLIQGAMAWRLGAMAGGHRIFVAQNTTLKEVQQQLGRVPKAASLDNIGIMTNP